MLTNRNIFKKGRLTARPDNRQLKDDVVSGVHPLNLDKEKDGLVYIPESYDPDHGSALAIMLHGANGNAEHGLSLIRGYADENNIILIAPVSRDYSWDIISRNSFGPDVVFINEALAYVFEKYNVNTSKLAIGGFSDGASYALCIGLSNGDLFTHIMAFSPGFVHAPETAGTPQTFISHGTNDDILPIKPCSDRIVEKLKNDGYNPVYMKFNGGHQLPVQISKAAIKWFLG